MSIKSFLSTNTSITKKLKNPFGSRHRRIESMHSAIEDAVENHEIELPWDYVRAMKVARKDANPTQ